MINEGLLYTVIVHLLIANVFAGKIKDEEKHLYKAIVPADYKFPFVVLLIFEINRNNNANLKTCTGCLIKLDTVLTAAHCLENYQPEQMIAVAGKSNITDYIKFRKKDPSMNVTYPSKSIQDSIASSFYIHPKFLNVRKYDLGVVKLAKPFRRTKYVRPISYTTDEYPGNMLCFILGYGLDEYNKSDVLMYYTTRQVRKNMYLCETKRLFDYEFYCVVHEYSSRCVGDAGGPLVCNKKVWGVLSAYQPANQNTEPEECGDAVILKYFKLSLSDKHEQFLLQHTIDIESQSSCHHYLLSPQLYVFITSVILFL